MPTQINPFRGIDPTAKMIADLGTSMFGNQGAGALRKEQIIAAQRGNDGSDRLDKAIMADPQGMAGVMATPLGQAFIAASGRAPKDFADLGLAGSAMQNGATSPTTQNAQVGAGQSYDNTYGAFKTKADETAHEFNDKPLAAIDANGNAVFARQGGDLRSLFPVQTDSEQKGRLIGNNWDNMAPGSTTPLSDEQERILGAAPKSSTSAGSNYIAPDGSVHLTADGKTDLQSGQPLPPGGHLGTITGSTNDVLDPTNTLKTNLQNSIVNNGQFVTQAGAMVDMAKAHPEAFGPVGYLRGVGQEAMQTGAQLLGLVGGDGAFKQAQDAVGNAGLKNLFPDMYDANLPKARAAYYVLLYNYASALTGQSGRSVSDKDIEIAQRALGNPDDLFGSANNFITKVQTAQALAAHNVEHSQFLLKNGFDAVDPNDANFSGTMEGVSSDLNGQSNTTAPVTAPGGPPAPAAPAGAPVPIKDDADYAALPSGTLFLAPDGTTRKKP